MAMPSSSPRRWRPASGIWRGWRTRLDRLPVAVVDVETTGLDPQRDRVLEIAVLVDGVIVVESLVRAPGGVGGGPHALTDQLIREAPSFGDLAGLVTRALTGRMVVGHNAAFDVAFLRAELDRAGARLPRLPYLCTATLPRLLGLEHPTRRLTWACERFGIPLERPHEAAADARAAAALFGVYANCATRQALGLPDLARRLPDDPCVRSWTCPPLRLAGAGASPGPSLTRAAARAA